MSNARDVVKMMGDRLESHRTRRSDVRVQEVGRETLILDEQAGEIHQLNETASFVWRYCDGKTTLRQIATRLTQDYDVDIDVADRDVVKVVDELDARNLFCD